MAQRATATPARPTTPVITYVAWNTWTTVRLYVALVLALVIGWFSLRPALLPADPLAAVSLRLDVYSGWLGAYLFAAIMLALISAVATLIAGDLPDIGLASGAAALAMLAQQRDGLPELLRTAIEHPFNLSPADAYMRLASELILWTVLLAVPWLVGRAIEVLLFKREGTCPLAVPTSGLADATPVDQPTLIVRSEVNAGLKAAGLAAISAAVVTAIVAQDTGTNQVAAGLLVGGLAAGFAAHRITRVRMTYWMVLGIALAGVAAYVVAARTFGPAVQVPGRFELGFLPPNHLASATPLQFASFGAAGVVFGLWLSQRTYRQNAAELAGLNTPGKPTSA